MIELPEIMAQKNDLQFTELLNRFRTASHTEEDINLIISHSIAQSPEKYPSDALHIWAENDPVNEHNNNSLNSYLHLCTYLGPLTSIPTKCYKTGDRQYCQKEDVKQDELILKLILKKVQE